MPIVRSIFDAVVEFTDKNLNSTAINYLHSRGWDDSVITQWHLGFFPKNKNAELFSILAKHKYNKNDLEDFYIMSNSEKTLLYNRIIFPVWNTHGNLIAVTGRDLDDSIKPKYFNTAYDKRSFLYGLNFAIPFIRKTNVVYVFEGNADVVSSHKFDIKNSVCCQGTAFTKEHYILLSRYAENICLIFDNDSGGRGALGRFNKRSEEFFIRDKHIVLNTKDKEVNVYISMLKGVKDPDAYLLKHGKDKFIENVKEQMNDEKLQIEFRKILPKVVDKNGKKRSN